MNRIQLVLILALATARVAADEPRSWIVRLLDPATRVEAFREFRLREANDAQSAEWKDAAAFAKDHAALRVTAIRQLAGAQPLYLVTHRFFSDTDDAFELFPESSYGRASFERLFQPAESARDVPIENSLTYYVFDPDGTRVVLGGESTIFNGNVADLNADGVLDLVQLNAADVQRHAAGQAQVLTVTPLAGSGRPAFAVAFNIARDEPDPGAWDCRIADPDGDGFYEIEFGPRGDAGVQAQVTYRWEATEKRWTGPAGKKGDHFRVLRTQTPAKEASELIARGEFAYPRSAAAESLGGASRSSFDLEDSLPADQVSKPYRYRSLAGASDVELYARMKAKRSLWDVKREQVEHLTTVPDFWKLDPKAAALAFARANCPPEARRQMRWAVDDLDGKSAPEEGSLTLSDAPSGCFAPSGAFIHHLRCARDGSFFIYAAGIDSRTLQESRRYDLRKIELPYEDARQFLQTVWWLNQLRGRLDGPDHNSSLMGGSSTSDGWASIQLESAGGPIVFSGQRYALGEDDFALRSAWNATYDKVSFLNLAVRLIQRELPDRIGERWKRLGPAIYWFTVEAPTPERRAQLQAQTADFIRLFNDGSVPAAVGLEAVGAAIEFGWRDREDIAAMERRLAPPTAAELRLREIDAEIAVWRKTFGSKDTSWHASFLRRNPLDLVPPPGGELPKPKAPADAAKFAALDALYAEHDALGEKQPKAEKQMTQLREVIPRALRYFEIYDQPEALERAAREEPDEEMTRLAIRRLSALDRPRSIVVLNELLARGDDWPAGYYRSALHELGVAVPPPAGAQPQAPEHQFAPAKLAGRKEIVEVDVPWVIELLRDAKAGVGDREAAIKLLVPPMEPRRFPASAIDTALAALAEPDALGKSADALIRELSRALAQRPGPRTWRRLARLADTSGWTHVDDVLPALTLLAQREPKAYRTQLAGLLSPHFRNAHGGFDEIFWSIWQANVRELKAELERVGTSGPEDAESTLATSTSSLRQPVRHRFHRARHVLALWNEEDAPTRAKLLVAFALGNAGEFDEDHIGARDALREQLAVARRALDAAQQTEVLRFAEWCAAQPADRTTPGEKTELLPLSRQSLTPR